MKHALILRTRPGRVAAVLAGAVFFALWVTARADFSDYDDTFTFGGTEKASMDWRRKWALPLPSFLNPKLGHFDIPHSSLSNITGATLNGASAPTDSIISNPDWPKLELTTFVFDGSYDVLPSGDYFFYTVDEQFKDGLNVIPDNGKAPVMTADVHTQGITTAQDSSWARMDLLLSNIRIDNRIHSALLDEFAAGDGSGAVRIDLVGNDRLLDSFRNKCDFEVQYIGEVGVTGGSAVPTPAEWATILMTVVVLGGYGTIKRRKQSPALGPAQSQCRG